MSQCLAVTLASPSLGGMLIIFSGGWGGGFGDFALNMDLFSYSFRFLTVKIHLRFEPVNPPPNGYTHAIIQDAIAHLGFSNYEVNTL